MLPWVQYAKALAQTVHLRLGHLAIGALCALIDENLSNSSQSLHRLGAPTLRQHRIKSTHVPGVLDFDYHADDCAFSL